MRFLRHKKISLLIALALVLIGLVFFYKNEQAAPLTSNSQGNIDEGILDPAIPQQLHPLAIASLRKGSYPGSDITVEETLAPGSNYSRYLVSYKSDGLKIYAYMTVPVGQKPATGWPVIIFNHGFIPPAEYRSTERYIAYVDGFARNGYIVFRSDYRGHGDSEGEPTGAYGSTGYTVDILNAVSSIKKYKDADPNRIGMWGHSLGGFITLRSMVTTKDIKAGVIWAGVVGSYPDMITGWRRSTPPPGIPTGTARRWRQQLIEQYGEPSESNEFWRSISANFFLQDISGPLQLHHAKGDYDVPYAFSEKLDRQMKAIGKQSELYLYQGDDHNIANNFFQAMQKSIEFFDKYVKEASQTPS